MLYKKIKAFLVFQFVYLIFLITFVNASGLNVKPTLYYWKNVPLGKSIECPQSINIKNKSNAVISFKVKTYKPSNLGLDIEDGYDEIPSKKWISFEKKHLTSNPKQTIPLKVFVNIPNKKKYLNKKWEVIVSIQEHFRPSNMFSIVNDVKLLISTITTK